MPDTPGTPDPLGSPDSLGTPDRAPVPAPLDTPESLTAHEIASQPEVWQRALDLLPSVQDRLPSAGERVAIIGCGTSWFMATAYAGLREAAGQGLTDAWTASEIPTSRRYDRVIALSRSGTTSEIVEVLSHTRAPSVLVTAVGGGPAADHAEAEIVLDFADEASVVQTRFASTALLLLRASLGEDLSHLPDQARRALAAPMVEETVAADQITFLGTGWTIGLAEESALKLRESSQSWTEAYYATEYRHGPIAIAQPGRVIWHFGPAPAGLAEQVAATGADVVTSDLDPLADLVRLHRVALARAAAKGLDPDTPRNLSRAVILDPHA